MMLDFNGNNRGFCFVTYKTRTESQAALKGINNFEIRKGRLLGKWKRLAIFDRLGRSKLDRSFWPDYESILV